MKFVTIARGVFIVLLIAVTYLTVTPNPEDVEGGMDFARWVASMLFGNANYGDKVAHFLAYSALGASAALAEIRIGGKLLLTISAFALYGASLEGVQALGAVRDPELLDALANSMGALVSYPIATRAIEFARAKAQARA
jgi:hypothetical protein